MENKKKYVYYMQPSMAEEMELMLGEANATSRSDFVNIAVRFYVLIYSENKSIMKTTKGEESYGKQKEICLLHAAVNV